MNGFSFPVFIYAATGIESTASLLSLGLGQSADDVRISGIGDGQGADAVVATASGSQLDVVAAVVVHSSLGQHGVVLDLGLPARIKGNERVGLV